MIVAVSQEFLRAYMVQLERSRRLGETLTRAWLRIVGAGGDTIESRIDAIAQREGVAMPDTLALRTQENDSATLSAYLGEAFRAGWRAQTVDDGAL